MDVDLLEIIYRLKQNRKFSLSFRNDLVRFRTTAKTIAITKIVLRIVKDEAPCISLRQAMTLSSRVCPEHLQRDLHEVAKIFSPPNPNVPLYSNLLIKSAA